jgi:hypothetical protein
MSKVAAMNTLEPIAFSVSSVPSVAGRAELRSLEGVFHHHLNPLFLTLSFQQLHQSSIQPMGQPPVKHARDGIDTRTDAQFGIYPDSNHSGKFLPCV